VLDRALTHGGTSLKDFVNADGREGENAEYLLVYDRTGQPCLRPACGGAIRRVVIQGRATFYCPRCQLR
jgi:formamidopyrimidine-DNA glycosylase